MPGNIPHPASRQGGNARKQPLDSMVRTLLAERVKETSMFTRILVPTDFSKPSDAALAHARRLADSMGASLHVLHVVDNMFLRAVLGDPRDYEAAALRQLQDRVPAEDRGQMTSLAVERSDQPAERIIGYARAHGIDLIVMGTHGRGRVAHLLLGSVAEKVARTAPCPVLTMRDAPPLAGIGRASNPGADRLQPLIGRSTWVCQTNGREAWWIDRPSSRGRASRDHRSLRI